MNTKEYLRNRITASLMAGALGDALGYEIEFEEWDEIREAYGENGIRNPVLHGGKARFSDDTQMTLFTNEALVLGYWRSSERGIGANAEYYVYENYLLWLKTQSGSFRNKKSMWEPVSELYEIPELHAARAPGNTCISALDSGQMGTMEEPINNSKGCGGVMRTAPLGFLWDFGSPLRNGAACAAVTHGHPGGWIPAGILSDIVYRCIYGQSYDEGMPRVHSRDGSGIPACITVRPLEEIILSAVDDAEEMWESYPDAAKIGDMIRRAAELSRTDIPEAEAIHSIGGGWVGDEALAIAVYCVLRHPDDLRQCLITAVNHSGDSDSTGAIAGNILGAYLGEDALPEDWVCELEMTDVIRQQAENMASVIVHW